ncbi:MAG TPA: hypothetical protein VKE70_03505, partial [Candidatus Solibacter sp.]|nr:hypothetical protein [Candidatus Solibacter sp.]
PQLQTWQSRMLNGGSQFCNAAEINAAIGSSGVSTEGNVWYYDGTRVYAQIAAYTKDATWYTCAGYTNRAYTDWVLTLTNGVSWAVGALNGWRIFPDGALSDYRRTGNANSRLAVVRLAKNSAWAEQGGDASCDVSRETAYIMNAYVAAERIGEPRNPLLETSVVYALGHINQWFVTRTCSFAPFMVGLTLEALMNYHELTKDSRILPAVQTAADGLWDRAWVASGGGFMYDTVSDPTAAPDLNLLIAPAYAWLWQLTGAQKYLDEGDQVFAGGVLGATFWSGKQSSQSYRSSFNYVKWRSSAPGTIPLTGYGY